LEFGNELCGGVFQLDSHRICLDSTQQSAVRTISVATLGSPLNFFASVAAWAQGCTAI